MALRLVSFAFMAAAAPSPISSTIGSIIGSPMPYTPVFWTVIVLTVVVHCIASLPLRARVQTTAEDSKESCNNCNGQSNVSEQRGNRQVRKNFAAFQVNYLTVYLLAVAADWLQGPYVYALYTYYGYSKADVGQLYIAGFASSAVFGTFIASVADKYGRKSNSLLYCLVYILSCATKHYGNFWILVLGRLLGGVAYSILFSAFESWMVAEHTARAYPASLLGSTFAKAQLCNGIVAIFAGKTAGWFADTYGKVMPFDISICVLVVLSFLIFFTWTENYGDKSKSIHGGFKAAWHALLSDKKILLLGIIQAAFEGAMYTFTFVWTPALQAAHDNSVKSLVHSTGGFNRTVATSTASFASEIPHGTIFSTFMAATMIGSSIFAICMRFTRVEVIMRAIFAIGTGLFAATMLRDDIFLTYASFVAFEVLCGIYFPAMGTMRAPYIPEENRSALLTFFRVPLNVIVVLTLYEDLSLRKVFLLCASLLFIALVCQHWLLQLSRAVSYPHSKHAPIIPDSGDDIEI